MNKVIIPYVCPCGGVDAIIVDEKSWINYKPKKLYLEHLTKRMTLCGKCSKKYLK